MAKAKDIVLEKQEYKGEKIKVLRAYNIDEDKVVLPMDIQGIGSWCQFSAILKEIKLPKTLFVLDSFSLHMKDYLTNINLENVKYFDTHCLSDTRSLNIDVNLKEAIEINEGAFNRSGINSVTFSDNLIRIGSKAFYNCKNLKQVIIPKTVKTIENNAFERCSNLETVIIEEGVEVIEKEAFYGCTKLKNICLPKSLVSIGEKSFYLCPGIKTAAIPSEIQKIYGEKLNNYLGIGDENDCIIVKNELISYVGTSIKAKISDGVKVIKKSALADYLDVFNRDKVVIELPDTVKKIEDDNCCNDYMKMNMPKNYLRQTKTLPAGSTFELIYYLWDKDITDIDCAYLYLFQSAKDVLKIALKNLSKNPDTAAKIFVDILKEDISLKQIEKAVEFVRKYNTKIEIATIKELYNIILKVNKDEAELLKEYIGEEVIENKNTSTFKSTYTEYALDKILETSKIKGVDFSKVRLSNSIEYASEYLVKCAIAPYLEVLNDKDNLVSSKSKFLDYYKVKLNEEADEVAALLNRDDLINVFINLFNINGPLVNISCIVVLARYGSQDIIRELIAKTTKWKEWNVFGKAGRDAITMVNSGLMLSDNREAILYLDKNGLLDYYAKIRNITAKEIRDEKLVDFGFDENGKITYDLGNTVIEASILTDLSIGLFDVSAGKIVKSLPKRGADNTKYENCNSQYNDLKKNIKSVIKNRNDYLLGRFLSGTTFDSGEWLKSYQNNPILNRIASLLVWKQGSNTFTFKDKVLINSYGDNYTLTKEDIRVAHPIEMDDDDIERWQKYFADNKIKQPFEQVWEIKINERDIKINRYRDYDIPLYRFINREKHCIKVSDFKREDLSISFDDLKTDITYEAVPGYWFNINANTLITIENISFDRFTRKVNHTIAYLDKCVIFKKIENDEDDIINIIKAFTVAQIDDMLKFAIEKNSPKCTALLMNYKNEHFKIYKDIDSFTLDI